MLAHLIALQAITAASMYAENCSLQRSGCFSDRQWLILMPLGAHGASLLLSFLASLGFLQLIVLRVQILLKGQSRECA